MLILTSHTWYNFYVFNVACCQKFSRNYQPSKFFHVFLLHLIHFLFLVRFEMIHCGESDDYHYTDGVMIASALYSNYFVEIFSLSNEPIWAKLWCTRKSAYQLISDHCSSSSFPYSFTSYVIPSSYLCLHLLIFHVYLTFGVYFCSLTFYHYFLIFLYYFFFCFCHFFMFTHFMYIGEKS